MNSNDITVAMVTNVLQKEGKQNKTENQGKGIKWNKQRSIALAFVEHVLIPNASPFLRLRGF